MCTHVHLPSLLFLKYQIISTYEYIFGLTAFRVCLMVLRQLQQNNIGAVEIFIQLQNLISLNFLIFFILTTLCTIKLFITIITFNFLAFLFNHVTKMIF